MTITQIASLPCNELRSSKTWIRVKREEGWKVRSIERQLLCAIKHLAVDTDLGKQEVQATLAETLRKGRDAPIPAIRGMGIAQVQIESNKRSVRSVYLAHGPVSGETSSRRCGGPGAHGPAPRHVTRGGAASS
jgi:hypothetical protein